MGQKFYRENHRVVIEPRSPLIYIQDEKRRHNAAVELCKQIAKDVTRHVDDVGYVMTDFDVVYTCEFCGALWTEESEEYNGGCCAEDEAVYSINAAWPDALERPLCPVE